MLEACRPRRLAAAATGRSPLVQTALPNGVAPSCWSTAPSAVSDVSGAGAFARAVCRECAPYPIRRSVNIRRAPTLRMSLSQQSPALAGCLSRAPAPLPSRAARRGDRRFGRVVEAAQLRMDSKRGPSCGYVRLPAQPFEAAQDDARGQSKAGRGHGQTGGRSCCCGGRRDARILFRRVESHGPGRGDDGGRIL